MTPQAIPDASRRPEITAAIQAETGIDEAMIHRLVHNFYARIRQDPVLGSIFESRIQDWEPHLRQMGEFWSSVALMTGRYHGQPMRKHLPLPVGAAHFGRWLALFEQTARELCTETAADHFITRARRIADSLLLGIEASQGILPVRAAANS
jgi:hemoglobin